MLGSRIDRPQHEAEGAPLAVHAIHIVGAAALDDQLLAERQTQPGACGEHGVSARPPGAQRDSRAPADNRDTLPAVPSLADRACRYVLFCSAQKHR